MSTSSVESLRDFRFNHSEHKEGTAHTAFSIGLAAVYLCVSSASSAVKSLQDFRVNHSEHSDF